MFGISLCVLFLKKLRWPEKKNFYDWNYLTRNKTKKKQKTNKKNLAKIESIQVLCNGRDIVTGVLHVISLAAKD